VPQVTFNQSHGLSSLPLEEETTPNYSLNTHAPDQTDRQPCLPPEHIDLAAPSLSHSAFDSAGICGEPKRPNQ